MPGEKGKLVTIPRVIHNNAASEYFFEEGCYITEWWNSLEDESVSIARARVEPGVTTKLHRLKGVTERYVILEGTGVVRVGDLPSAVVGPGDVVAMPPGTPQQISNIGSGDLVFLAICTPRFTREVYEGLSSLDPASVDVGDQGV